MILSGSEIRSRIGEDIHIVPFNKSRVNPNSYNLRLHDELVMYDNPVLDMKEDNPCHCMKIPEEGLMLIPGNLYLGRTHEYTKTNNLVPMLEGRSSIGRLGLSIHVTAGFGDVGFEGYWTLEMHCIKPIIIYPFIDICQIYYHTVEGRITNYEGGKYQKNNGIQSSQLYKELRSKIEVGSVEFKGTDWEREYELFLSTNGIKTNANISDNFIIPSTLDLIGEEWGHEFGKDVR